MKKLMFYGLCVAALMGATTTPVFARELGDYLSKERFQLRARVLGVLPDDDSSVNIGGEADVGDAITPEVDVTYFFTPNISAELIAATAQHSITYTGDTHLGNTWILPPAVTL
jgi:outer membrane protein